MARNASPRPSQGLSSATAFAMFKTPPDQASPTSAHISALNTGRRSKRTPLSHRINTVNALISRFRVFMQPFCCPASKNPCRLRLLARRTEQRGPLQPRCAQAAARFRPARQHIFLTSPEGSCAIFENPDCVEMHHVKHIRKGKAEDFSQILQALNRKTSSCVSVLSWQNTPRET